MAPAVAPAPIFLKDYLAPAYLVDTVELHFELQEEATLVASRLSLRRNPAPGAATGPLVLLGRQLELKSIRVDGRPWDPDRYRCDAETLTLEGIPEHCVLEIETLTQPAKNTSLEGLYLSNGIFCTQCEAQGFRKITYFPDRPDVMARFTTTIAADRGRYPVLLSNGNPVAQGELEGGRHFVRWEDPFPKPSYLFALVAGDLALIEDRFVTCSQREVALRIYVEPRNRDKCGHAMASLQRAMRWDEETFGLEYDLDIFMIVAVDDFNMGAMENKGLNVFNSKYVLARPETATDADYQAIEEVIGHEYFHNWTGNRVTCRDWFQLSLKEGLTVFRDQQFSADMTSPPVKRIQDVRVLRNGQFPEDGGPLAHPVRPASYVEINNFYTATVYNKGAEVIRMYHTLLGSAGFRRGMDLYLSRHDGQAVTTDDFLRAMAEAGACDLGQFARWYSQAGTPELTVTRAYDPISRIFQLTIRQSCPATPGQETKEPFHIPLALGLLHSDGRDLPLQLEGEEQPAAGTTRVLSLRQPVETFRFVNIPAPPVPSLLRGFSAPVRLQIDLEERELAFLMAHDSDPFNRWEAGQQLFSRLLLRLAATASSPAARELPALYRDAFRRTLLDEAADPAFRALALTLPSEIYLAELRTPIDPEALHEAREWVRTALAAVLKNEFLTLYRSCRQDGPYSADGAAVGRRSLKNLCLAYLTALEEPALLDLCLAQYRQADNMTDAAAALAAMLGTSDSRGGEMLAHFYQRWQDDPLVVDKWFSLQATAGRPDTLVQVQQLLLHPAFTLKNPNRVRALLGAFAQGNPARFHRADGAGYALLADQVLTLDRLNPQVAARLVGALGRWRHYEERFATPMRQQLQRIADTATLSRDVFEIVSKSLG